MRQPKNPIHPGEFLLEEFLKPSGITQVAFAKKLGWTKTRLNELIRSKRRITAESALDLAAALGTSAKLWMNLQATYDLDLAAKRAKAAYGQKLNFPGLTSLSPTSPGIANHAKSLFPTASALESLVPGAGLEPARAFRPIGF
jgi:antitoxin HigA-1